MRSGNLLDEEQAASSRGHRRRHVDCEGLAEAIVTKCPPRVTPKTRNYNEGKEKRFLNTTIFVDLETVYNFLELRGSKMLGIDRSFQVNSFQ